MPSIVNRVKEILLDPKGTWPRIDAEAATPASLVNPYLLLTAAVPAVATFIALSIFGIGGFGFHMRFPIGAGLVQMVVGFVLSLVMVYVMSLVVNALAPTFGGRKDPISALKLMVYGSTASLLGGVFILLPWGGSLLGLLASFYSIYLLYTGLPVLMKNPPERSLVYTVVLIVCGFVLGLVVAGLMSLLRPSPHMMMGDAGDAGVTITTPKGELKIDTRKAEEMAKKIEAATQQMEAAGKSGDGAAAGAAAAAAMAAITGGSHREPVPAADLKALLPAQAAGLARRSYEAERNTAMGIAVSQAKARYGEGDRQVDVNITDAGALGGLTALAGWANLTTDRETDTEIERVGKQGNRTVREKVLKDGSQAEYTVILPNGVLVEVRGHGVSGAEAKQVLDGIDLAQLEKLGAQAK